MASNSDKSMITGIGLVLLVGGAGLAYWGYQMSHSLVSQLSQAFTGALPNACDVPLHRGCGELCCGIIPVGEEIAEDLK